MPIKTLFLAAATLVSGVAAADALTFGDTIKGIQMGGTERMMVMALSDPGLPAEAHAARDGILGTMGILGEPGRITRTNLSFSPVLTHDSNINGGYGSTTIIIDGLNFNVDKDYEALDGILLGGSVSTGLRMALGHKTALSLSGSTSLAWSPEHDMWKNSVNASACVNHMFTVQTWSYGCLDASYRSIDLGESTRYGARVGVNQLFFSGIGLHEVTAEIQHNEHESGKDYDQDVVSVSMTTALTGGYSVAFGAQLGEGVEEVSVMRHRVFAGVGFELFDRPSSVTVGLQKNDGGIFLGSPVENEISSISVSHQVTKKVDLSIYASRTDSNVEFYNDNQFGMNVGFRF